LKDSPENITYIKQVRDAKPVVGVYRRHKVGLKD